MPARRSTAARLAMLDAALNPSGPPPMKVIEIHKHPDGRTVPPLDEHRAAVEVAQAEGFAVRSLEVVYTQHSIDAGHGPKEWQNVT